MKKHRISLFRVLLVLAGGLGILPGHAPGAVEVISPVKRQELLDQAKKLLAVRETTIMAADPFHSEAFAEVIGAAKRPAVEPGKPEAAGPRSPRALLEAIAANLKPSGNYILGGQPILAFGQRRVKAGGSLTVTFEGTAYTLEITAITPPNFTLRLNREEFTRPIK